MLVGSACWEQSSFESICGAVGQLGTDAVVEQNHVKVQLRSSRSMAACLGTCASPDSCGLCDVLYLTTQCSLHNDLLWQQFSANCACSHGCCSCCWPSCRLAVAVHFHLTGAAAVTFTHSGNPMPLASPACTAP